MINIKKLLELPKLGKDDSFTFGCNRCNSCCREREDIILTPLDLFKISKYLNKFITDILGKYCNIYEGPESKIPVVRIKPLENKRKCPFVKKDGCIIQPVKPAICALYPLGRMTNEEKNELTYFVQPTTCGNKKHTQTIRQWLAEFSILNEEDFTILWHQKLNEISGILRELYSKTSFNHDTINSVLAMNLYIFYDLEKDFLPQFTHNCEEILRLINVITKKFNEGELVHA